MYNTVIVFVFSFAISLFMGYLMSWDLRHRFIKDVYSRYKVGDNCKNVVMFHNISMLSTLVFSGTVLYGLSILTKNEFGTPIFIVLLYGLGYYLVVFKMIKIQKVLKGEC